MTAAKQAFHEVRGARGEVILVNDITPGALKAYHTVRFEPVTTTLSQKVIPPNVIRSYDEAYRRYAAELAADPALYPGHGRELAVQTEVLFFEEKGLLGSAQLLARVQMRESGRLVIDAIVRTVSRAFREGGVTAMTDESAKALRKFLANKKGIEDPDNREDEHQADGPGEQ